MEEDFILDDRTNNNFYLGSTTINTDNRIYVHSELLIKKMPTQFKLETIKEQETPTTGDRVYSHAHMNYLEDKIIGKHQINYYKQF